MQLLLSQLVLLAGVTAPVAATPSLAYSFRNVAIVAGGFMPGVVYHPTTRGLAYIRSDMGGAYRLEANTRRWTPLLDFTRDYVETGVESIALDAANPDRLYLACGTSVADWAPRGFLLRSSDRGDHFERIALPFKCGGNEDGRSIGERLVVDPHRPNRLWMGTRQAGLWRSDDRGSTWSRVESFPVNETTTGQWPNIGVCFVLIDSDRTLYAGVASPADCLYRSRDEGATWEAVPGLPSGMFPHHGVLTPTDTLYLTCCDQPGPNGVGDGRVVKLHTKTDAVTDITPNLQPGQKLGYGYAGLAVDPRRPDTLMVSTTCRWWPGDDQWRSIDGGATWKQVGPTAERDPSASPYLRWGKPANQKVGAGNWEGSIAIDPFDSDRVLYVTGATVWGCDDITNLDRDQPTHWVVRGQGIEQTAVLDLISPSEGPHLISGLGDIGGFVHDDLDVSPTQGMMNPYMTNRSLDWAGQAPGVVVRAGDGLPVPGCISTDGAQTWTAFARAPVPQSKAGSIAVSADGQAVLWSPAGQPPYRSLDRGATWTPSDGCAGAVVLTSDRVDPLRFYALPARRDDRPVGALVSVDGGRTFRSAAADLRGKRLRAVPGLAGHVWQAAPDGLWRSTDGAASFVRIANVDSAWSVAFGQAAPGERHPAVFMAGSIGGVMAIYRSDNGGVNWARLNDDQHMWGGLYGPLEADLRVFGRFYLGTNGRGIILGEPR